MLRIALQPSHHKYKMLPSKAHDTSLHVVPSNEDSTDNLDDTQHIGGEIESTSLKSRAFRDLRPSFRRNTQVARPFL